MLTTLSARLCCFHTEVFLTAGPIKTQSGNRSRLVCLSLWYPVVINTVALWDGKMGAQNEGETLVATLVFRIHRDFSVIHLVFFNISLLCFLWRSGWHCTGSKTYVTSTFCRADLFFHPQCYCVGLNRASKRVAVASAPWCCSEAAHNCVCLWLTTAFLFQCSHNHERKH